MYRYCSAFPFKLYFHLHRAGTGMETLFKFRTAFMALIAAIVSYTCDSNLLFNHIPVGGICSVGTKCTKVLEDNVSNIIHTYIFPIFCCWIFLRSWKLWSKFPGLSWQEWHLVWTFAAVAHMLSHPLHWQDIFIFNFLYTVQNHNNSRP